MSNNLAPYADISILAPTRGATSTLRRVKSCGRNFNPRSHEGSDTDPGTEKATDRYFNPRSHEGSDQLADGRHRSITEFQSSLPRGERPFCVHQCSFFRPISILAPTRGATTFLPISSRVQIISILAPTRGATLFP